MHVYLKQNLLKHTNKQKFTAGNKEFALTVTYLTGISFCSLKVEKEELRQENLTFIHVIAYQELWFWAGHRECKGKQTHTVPDSRG